MKRQELEELARREVNGEQLWALDATKSQRVRLFAYIDLMVSTDAQNRGRLSEKLASDIRLRFRLNEGLILQQGYWDEISALARREPFAFLLTTLEYALDSLRKTDGTVDLADGVEKHINKVLAEERLLYEFIDGKPTPIGNRELHAEVVAPTLRLLSGRDGWDGVERAYQDALSEIGRNPADAITDAGTALQEALKILGADGNRLGPLAKSARAKGLLGPHDNPMVESIVRLIDWVSSDRSENGDGHNAAGADRHDAWLAVHVVGSLILRLASGPPRGDGAV